MNRAKFHYFIRRTHRFMGVFLGIQFLLWTIGGLYFSWTKIDEIRGENLRQKTPSMPSDWVFVSPSVPLAQIKKDGGIDSVVSIQTAVILGKPYYQILFQVGKDRKTQLADALTGALRPPLSKEEATAVSLQSFKEKSEVVDIQYITSTNGHHEYREKPLPAYAVKLSHPTNTTVYVAAELGTVQSFRNDRWRIFDFLWMLHVMDFENRDDINNNLLRGFSLLGIVTLCSGFLLFFVSYRTKR
ncbi:MAG: hypothetical protein JNL70_10355 [Saprospiraceae bacterium]|nr:hypothetical protein [Saprospiraceae bacterium]